MTAEEAAAFLGGGLTAKTVTTKAKKGQLPYMKFGHQILRFKQSDLEAFGREQAGGSL